VTDRRTKITLVVLALLFLLALHVGYRWVGYRALSRRSDRPAGQTTEKTSPQGPPSGQVPPGMYQGLPGTGSR